MGICVSSSSVATVPLDEITVSIFGLDNAGKTCLLRSLAGNFNFDSVPSVGLNQESFMYDDIRLKVFDLSGNSKFRSVWERYYAEIWGFIYVVDAADTNRFEESKATLKEMISHKMMKDKPYIVVANKQDLAGAVPASKMKKILGLPRKVKIYDAIVTKIEGDKANEGVQTAISSLIGEIVENFQKIGQKRVKDMEEQKEIEEKAHQEKLKRIAELRAKQAAEEEAAQKEAAEKAAAAEQKQQIEPNEEKQENEN